MKEIAVQVTFKYMNRIISNQPHHFSMKINFILYISSIVLKSVYSKDEGTRVKLPNGHQWTPKDCKKGLYLTKSIK